MMSSQQSAGIPAGWAVAMGHVAALGPAAPGALAHPAEPNMFELSTGMEVGEGVVVTPG